MSANPVSFIQLSFYGHFEVTILKKCNLEVAILKCLI
jgi:hypothetical protein